MQARATMGDYYMNGSGADLLRASALSAETLASVLGQSVDCVKLLSLDGTLLWMNPNGQCALEIDDAAAVIGQRWSALWPVAMQPVIDEALAATLDGTVTRFDAAGLTAKGSPRWWNVCVSLVTGAGGAPAGFLAISRDITEARTGREALEIAVAEMQHRLKNTYAMVGSLLMGFARGNAEHEGFAREMCDRLVALSAAQSLSANEAPRGIAELIPALVMPFDSPGCPVVVAALPPARMTQGQADAVALTIGELAVNSAKHGALAGGGALRVGATVDADRLAIVWVERSHTAVAASSRPGGRGLQLIDRIVRARGGSLAIDWQSHGLTATLDFALV